MDKIVIVTSKVAAQVYYHKYGFPIQIDKSMHKPLMKTLLLPAKASTRLKDKEGRVELLLNKSMKMSDKVGVHLHESVMLELCTYLDAQIETGITFSKGILNYMNKYDLDDGILQLDTAKKHYYRYRQKNKELEQQRESSKKIIKIFDLKPKTNTSTVPIVFSKKPKTFLSFLTDVDAVIEATCKHLKIDVESLLVRCRKADIVYAKKILSAILYHGCEFRHIDIASYFNVNYNAAYHYVTSVDKNPKIYAKDLYQIFCNITGTFE